MFHKETCKCGNPRRKSGRYCLGCHAAYNRNFRKKHPLNAEQRRKMNLRSYTLVYVKRGHIKRENCFCGAKAEIHHLDYASPFNIEWLCRQHRLECLKKAADAFV